MTSYTKLSNNAHNTQMLMVWELTPLAETLLR